MQRILRIKQGRSISRGVALKIVAPIGLVLPARCFAELCMTGLYFIVISEQGYYLNPASTMACTCPTLGSYDGELAMAEDLDLSLVFYWPVRYRYCTRISATCTASTPTT